jgi:hypothetical protein
MTTGVSVSVVATRAAENRGKSTERASAMSDQSCVQFGFKERPIRNDVRRNLTYADLFAALEEVSRGLGRKVKPTVYTPPELARRRRQGNAFVTRVLPQPKIWLIGGERDLAL